jgi:hypothetical protein
MTTPTRGADFNKAVLYIIRLKTKPCDRCGDPWAELSVADYHVKDYANKVIVNLVCHRRHHTLGTWTLKLNEVRFIASQKPWKKRAGPRLPGGPR